MNPAVGSLLQTLLPMLGGMFSRRGATQGESRDQNNIEEILRGIKGQGGDFADIFGSDYDAFQKSFVDPQMSQFKNVTAPNIQQQYIADGQQRGTGMEDTLSRAGVDMQQNINQQYADFQDRGLNRKFQGLSGSFGRGQGAPPQGGFGQAVGGAMQGQAAQNLMSELMKLFQGSGVK